MNFHSIPVMESPISAGFPSPAMDYVENTIDICDFLIQHPNSTFILKVKWDSMKDAYIFNWDFLVVDKWINPSIGKIVIAELWNEFLCKELQKDSKWNTYLKAHNSEYKDLYPWEDEELTIWWVVVWKFNKV